MTVLRCPACGHRSDGDGEPFDLVVPYRGAATMQVDSVDPNGTLRVHGIDAGNPSHFYRPEIVCGECGHQWTTSRGWET